MVAFMVDDMREILEPIGLLYLLEPMDARAMEYFLSQPPRPSDPEMTSRRARNMRQVGAFRVSQGRYDQGLPLFSDAMTLLDESLRRNPDHPALLFEMAQLHFWIADGHFRQADFESAERQIRSYLEISEQLLERFRPGHRARVRAPGTTRWKSHTPTTIWAHWRNAAAM